MVTTTPVVDAVVATYNVRTADGLILRPGCFTASLQQSLPPLLLHHQRTALIGQAVAYQDTATALRMWFGFLDTPLGHWAHDAIRGGWLNQFSVGVGHNIWDGEGTYLTAALDEVSLTATGALPTGLLALRNLPVPA